MRISLFLLLFFSVIVVEARDFVKVPEGTDLVIESENLRLQSEQTIQKDVAKGSAYLGLGIQALSMADISTQVNQVDLLYPETTQVGFSFFSEFYPKSFGGFGFGTNLSYSYRERYGFYATSLHTIPVTAEILYKITLWNNQFKVTPKVGYTYLTLLQRGVDTVSGSENRQLALVGLSALMPMSDLGLANKNDSTWIGFEYSRSQAIDSSQVSYDIYQFVGAIEL